ncbi:MAG: peptidoglycan DD-metalloendopeptidase family protein [Patescibacteria group bacterium]
MPVIIFIGVFLLFNQITLAQTASSTSNNVIDTLNKQIDEQRAKIDQLAGKIEEYKKNLQDTRSKSLTLQNQISLIDNQIGKTNLDIDIKNEEIKATGLEIDKINLDIQKNQALIDRDKDQLAGFIRLIQRYDERSYLTVLLANNSFSEFFDQMKYSEEIQKDLQNTLNRIQENVNKLNTSKKQSDAKKEQLSQLLKTLENEKLSLGGQKEEKNFLVLQTKKSEKKFQGLVSNLKAEQLAATNQIASLERTIRAELAKKGKSEKLNTLGNASLNWPTDSQRITCKFHDSTYPYINVVGQHSGLDIGIRQGTPVKAAEAGYVAKVGLGTKWYGNYVMVIHSNNLSTLYAHFSSVSVTADQYVTRGQIIGYSGNTGFSSGPHLHFEVRSNGIPTDPLSYLP